MARLIVITKLLILFGFNFSIIPISHMVTESVESSPPKLVFWFFITMMLSLEIFLVIFPDFRSWLKQGIENGDGKLNSKDIGGLIIYYASLWFLRLFVLNHLLFSFYGVDTSFENQIILFMGATGGQGIGIIRSIVLRNKE